MSDTTPIPDVLNPEHDIVQRARWATEPMMRARPETMRSLVSELADEIERLRAAAPRSLEEER